MSTLSKLKLTSAQKPSHINPQQLRRNKLASKLVQQIHLAQAVLAGQQYTFTKLRSVKDPETGHRQQVTVNSTIKAWWFTADNGKPALYLRYGARKLELAKGKWAVELTSERDLVPTLEALKAAVLAGELDLQIEAVSARVKAGFKH